MTEKTARWEVFEGKDHQFYWRLIAANGEPVAQSEGYVTESGAWEGIRAAHRAAVDASEAVIMPGRQE